MSPGLADDDGQHLEPADIAALLGRDPTVASDVMVLLSQVLRKPASRHES